MLTNQTNIRKVPRVLGISYAFVLEQPLLLLLWLRPCLGQSQNHKKFRQLVLPPSAWLQNVSMERLTKGLGSMKWLVGWSGGRKFIFGTLLVEMLTEIVQTVASTSTCMDGPRN